MLEATATDTALLSMTLLLFEGFALFSYCLLADRDDLEAYFLTGTGYFLPTFSSISFSACSMLLFVV